MIPRCGPTFSLSFRSSDEDQTVGMSPRVAPRSADSAINPERLILIVELQCIKSSSTRSTVSFSARALDKDQELLAMPRVALDVIDHFTLMPFSARVSSPIWCTPHPRPRCIALISNAHRAAMSPTKENFRGNIVPHGRKKKNRTSL